jgi:putative ABC transport system ATP-binding protein
MLHAEGLDVSFAIGSRTARALVDVTVSFAAGELALVRGPSGSGKSTLLAVLGTLLTPDRGNVRLGDACLGRLSDAEKATFRLRHIGFVFQNFQLFDTLNALENATLPALMAGWNRRDAVRRATILLEQLGIADRALVRPNQMSGGEQQRVAIARALMLDPPVVLADEPTAALDGASGRQIASVLRDAASNAGRVVVVISHDERLLPFADRTLTLTDGRIILDERPTCAA